MNLDAIDKLQSFYNQQLVEKDKVIQQQAEKIERLEKMYYSFQLTGDEDSTMVQFEFQEGDREMEIEFTQDMQVKYLKVEGDFMEECEVVSAQQLLNLLKWLKGR